MMLVPPPPRNSMAAITNPARYEAAVRAWKAQKRARAYKMALALGRLDLAAKLEGVNHG